MDLDRIDLKSVFKADAQSWYENNPILATGFIGYETDTDLIKIFDGVHHYNDLPYVGSAGGGAGTTNYNMLSNKPQINNIELRGAKTLDELGIQQKGNYALKSDLYDVMSITKDETVTGKKTLTSQLTTNNVLVKNGNVRIANPDVEANVILLTGSAQDPTLLYGDTQANVLINVKKDSNLKINDSTGHRTVIDSENIYDYLSEATQQIGSYGIQGDYATQYGIIECPLGLLDWETGTKTVKIPASLQIVTPPVKQKTLLASADTYDVQSSSDVTLFVAEGEFLEANVENVYWQVEEPDDGDGHYSAWWNPANPNKKWQFKSNDTGNVWREAENATPIADIHIENNIIVRIDYVGYRVLNSVQYATLEKLNEVALQGDAIEVPVLETSADLSAVISKVNHLIETLKTRGVLA